MQTVSERPLRRLFNALSGYAGPWLMISGQPGRRPGRKRVDACAAPGRGAAKRPYIAGSRSAVVRRTGLCGAARAAGATPHLQRSHGMVRRGRNALQACCASVWRMAAYRAYWRKTSTRPIPLRPTAQRARDSIILRLATGTAASASMRARGTRARRSRIVLGIGSGAAGRHRRTGR